MNANETADGVAVGSTDRFGLGWRWAADEQSILLLFEVFGLAEDEHGNPCEAGVKLKIGPCGKVPTDEQCAATVAKLVASGLPGCVGMKATPITWEKYCAEGYADE